MCIRDSAAEGAFKLRLTGGARVSGLRRRQEVYCRMSALGSARPQVLRRMRLPVFCLAWVILHCDCVAFQAGVILGSAPALRSGRVVAPLRERNAGGGALKRRPPPFWGMCASGGAGGNDAPQTLFESFKKLPIIRTVFSFARWVVFSLQSLVVMRIAWMMRATASLQRSLLDPKQQLVRPPTFPLHTP